MNTDLNLEWQTSIAGGPEGYGLTYTVWHDTNCITVFKSRADDKYHYRHTESLQRGGGKVALLTIVDTRFRSGGGWADRDEVKRRAESYLWNSLRGAFVR